MVTTTNNSLSSSKNICILSRKNLERITRVVRQAKILSDAGHKVTVVSLGLPCKELLDSCPDVEFIQIDLLPKKTEGNQLRAETAQSSPSHNTNNKINLLRQLRLKSQVLLRNAGGRLVKLLFREFLKSLANLEMTYTFAHESLKVLAHKKFDYYQAHDNYALVAANKLSQLHQAKLIYDAVEISEHRISEKKSMITRLVETIERKIEEKIIKRADHLTTIGPGLADWYASRFQINRPILLRNCRLFTPASKTTSTLKADCGINEANKLIVWFGYIYPDQGLELLIESVLYLASDLHIAIIGDVLPRWNTFYQTLLYTTSDEKYAKRIHFLSAKNPNELIAYVSGADIGVIPRANADCLNIYHSLPNKLFEMIMARLPIVATPLPDIVSIIDQYQIGLICENATSQGLAETITHALEPEKYASLKACTENAASELSWENESQEYLAIFAA